MVTGDKKDPKKGSLRAKLALFLFDFVATEAFLSFGENYVFAENGVVFLQREFVWVVHGVFSCVIRSHPSFF